MARCALSSVKLHGQPPPRSTTFRGGIGSPADPVFVLSGPRKEDGAQERDSDAGQLPSAGFFLENCDAQQPGQGGADGNKWNHHSGWSRGEGKQVADRGHSAKHVPDDGESGRSTTQIGSV